MHSDCNRGYSLDEEYLAAFIACVIAGSTDPDKQVIPEIARTLRRSPKLRERIETSRADYTTHCGDAGVIWKPEQERVRRVIIKNARGHALYEYGEPMLAEPAHAWATPLEILTPEQRAGFENIDPGAAWPEVGSRMMTRMLTGQDINGSWILVQDGIYRYAVAQQGTLLVRSVLSEYLATEVYWA